MLDFLSLSDAFLPLYLHWKWQNQMKTLSFLLLLCLLQVVSSNRLISHDPCDSMSNLNSALLRSDQMTVVINGYSETRIPLLQSIATAYSASPFVHSVLVLWGNPNTRHQILSQLAHNLTSFTSSFGTSTITLIKESSSSLNARFFLRKQMKTRAILICDDDLDVDRKSVEFAFKVWASNPERVVGLFARSHDLDLQRKEWIYTVHPDKYSMVLTKFMILNWEYLWKYSCSREEPMTKMREIVDQMHNCEDILMNFVVSDATNAGPILVGAERARDYGDARNDERRVEVRDAGLSSTERGKGDHRRRRGKCIGEFHRILGRMPLRYNYGKLINSVGEQGLCEKSGKLVFCDQSVSGSK